MTMPKTPGKFAGLEVGFSLPQGLGYRFSFAEGQGARVESLDISGRVAGTSSLSALVAAIPCFTADCLILSGKGPIPAGQLCPGDLVVTRDNGLQPVRWIGTRQFDWRMLGLNPLLRPIRIAAGALGDGLPDQDLTLSPNHRLALCGPNASVPPSCENLVPARDLLGQSGVSAPPCHQVTYLQLLCDRHELLSVSGLWCESFRPTAAARAAFERAQRTSLDAVLRRIGGNFED